MAKKDQETPVTGDQPADKKDQPTVADSQPRTAKDLTLGDEPTPGEKATRAGDTPDDEERERQTPPKPEPATDEGELQPPDSAGEGPAADVPKPIRDHFVTSPPTEAQALVREQQKEAREENFQSPPLDQSASMVVTSTSGKTEKEIEILDVGGSLIINTHGEARLDREDALAFQKRIRRATQFTR